MPSQFRAVVDDYTMRAVTHLRHGALRSNELSRRIKAPDPMFFARVIRKMQRDGLAVKKIYALGPPAIITYELTDLGKTMIEPASAVISWVDRHGTDVMHARDLHHATKALERAGATDD